MNRFLKTCLIWVLALALPAQALTSAIKLTCGPKHHAMSSATVMAAEHSHHGMANADHHHDVADQADHHAPMADAADVPNKFKSSTCSACATCCVGAAVIPSHVDWTPTCRSTFVPVVSPSSSFTGYIPAGLERPPRLDLV